jgi:hypothetical protein
MTLFKSLDLVFHKVEDLIELRFRQHWSVPGERVGRAFPTLASGIPMLENVEAERSATQRDKSLNDPALPLWASTQAVAQQVPANAAKY